jgi:hypothetical protein
MLEIEIFKLFSEVKRGKACLTKAYCLQNNGDYPVYSADNEKPLGFCNSYDYDGRYLTISINGLAGVIKIIEGKFSTNADRVVCIPNADVNIDYVKYELENKLRKIAKGRKGEKGKNEFTKLTPEMILNTTIPMPVSLNDQPVFEIQEEMASRHKRVDIQKKKLQHLVELLCSVFVEIKHDSRSVNLAITDLFTPANGLSEYTKTYCVKHKGKYPVYSGNTQGEYAKIDSYDYQGEYLTWAKDGLAGLMMYHNEKFSLTGHRGILLPTKKCKNVDLKYIKYVLEPIFRKNTKGRKGDLGKNEYTTLNKEMIKKIKETICIPTNEDGSFDLEKQREIAKKYEQIEVIKQSLSKKINNLLNVNVI